ncbi:Uu.00g046740.m01.CDS01 [Anthostomella pinea]|uniref:Chromatin modification-related protein EAF6 n=1 Tax=Anthostomella pinea TaxID=933095 RepID=A0AAI8VCE5_9PEZI|nr:Uu.00g046740.m01.CDS01 [Anthostomella pinea]
MAENVQPAATPGSGANGEQPGIAHYEKQRQYVKELLQNRKVLERQLAMQEQSILQKETEYLESTPYGNIITGFDGYIKGSSSNTSSRKRAGQLDQNRVFSRSSISYNAFHPEHAEPPSATSTPGAPTPLSTSFAVKDKDGASNQPTPTSATTDKKAPNKKKKKKDADVEDSETDSREVKKIRTHFGASRK